MWHVGTACIYYANQCTCVRLRGKKKSAPAPPAAIKPNTGRRREGIEGLLFVSVSLLIDASHKTSTIRDHSSSFLPLQTPPPPPPPQPLHPTLILFTLSPAATPSFLPSSSVFSARWRRHTGFHAAACHVGFDPGGRTGGSSSLTSYENTPPTPRLSTQKKDLWILKCPPV